MNIHTENNFWTAIFVLIGITAMNPIAMAGDTPGNFISVDNIAIYLGIMPAEIIKGHPREHTESKMHGGIGADSNQNHVVVALFDNNSGKRIENAKVMGEIILDDKSNQQKTLEPMLIAGTITYGNYFDMPNNKASHIKIQIVFPGKAVIEAKFSHKHIDK